MPEREEPDVVEEAPVVKSGLSIVVILSMLLGGLLTVGAVGAFLHIQKNKVLQAEVQAVRSELKDKSIALDGMKAQIEGLSRQMDVLKEYSIARSSSTGGRDKNIEAVVPTVDAAGNAPKTPGAKEKTGLSETSIQPKAKKPKPEKQNCELVGKTPEEQAATLQRCVTLIDSPREKPRSR